jgi:hypothetical protein
MRSSNDKDAAGCEKAVRSNGAPSDGGSAACAVDEIRAMRMKEKRVIASEARVRLVNIINKRAALLQSGEPNRIFRRYCRSSGPASVARSLI